MKARHPVRRCAHKGCDTRLDRRQRRNVCAQHQHTIECNCRDCTKRNSNVLEPVPKYREPSLPPEPIWRVQYDLSKVRG